MRTIDRALTKGVRLPHRLESEARPPSEQEMREGAALYGAEGYVRLSEKRLRDAQRGKAQIEGDFSEMMVNNLSQSGTFLVVDNIAAYVYRRVETERFSLDGFPSLAPPRPTMWMEWPNSTGRERRGCLVCDLDVAHKDGVACVEDAAKNFPDVKVCWLLALQFFVEGDGSVFGPVAMVWLALDDRGRELGNSYETYTPNPAPDGTADEYPSWLLNICMVPLQAIAFMHCRNLKMETVSPPAKINHRHKMRTGRDLVRYQTIQLQVPRRQGSGGSGGTGDAALHIVDGHFAYYGDNHHDGCPPNHEPHGLLFGKLAGVYWMPMHARGSRERGEVITTERRLLPKVEG